MWTGRRTLNCNRWDFQCLCVSLSLSFVVSMTPLYRHINNSTQSIIGDPVLFGWPHSTHHRPQGWHRSRLWQVGVIAEISDFLNIFTFDAFPEFLWWRMAASWSPVIQTFCCRTATHGQIGSADYSQPKTLFSGSADLPPTDDRQLMIFCLRLHKMWLKTLFTVSVNCDTTGSRGIWTTKLSASQPCCSHMLIHFWHISSY